MGGYFLVGLLGAIVAVGLWEVGQSSLEGGWIGWWKSRPRLREFMEPK